MSDQLHTYFSNYHCNLLKRISFIYNMTFYLYQLNQWYLCYNILFICLVMQREYMNYVGSKILKYVGMYHKKHW